MVKWTLFSAFFLLFQISYAQDQGPRKVRLPYELKEVSGLYIQGADSLWWHNDSGDQAMIYRTNREGELQASVSLPESVTNVDWEDITYDRSGGIYLGDFGDNRRRRDNACVYRYDPDNQVVDQINFSYPDEEKYDVEAFLWFRDSLHLFTKSRISRADLPTYHFVIPATAGTHEAILCDSLYLRKRAVTAAAIDHSSGRMVLLAYYYTKRLGFIPYSAANIYCFEATEDGRWFHSPMRSRRISFVVATQYESIDFLNPTQLLVASEQTLFIKAKAKRVKWKN